MAWRYHGHAHPDPSNSKAQGICDGCNFSYQLSELKYQYEYRGSALSNTFFKKCPRCLDIPAVFKKTIIIPCDPPPVDMPRPSQFVRQMNQSAPVLKWDQAQGRWDDSGGSGTPHSVWL